MFVAKKINFNSKFYTIAIDLGSKFRKDDGVMPMMLADSLERLGTETAFDVLARAQKLKDKGQDIINLGIGQPDFPTPENIVEAAVKALKDGHHGYTPANGILPLREAVAADMAARRGVTIDPERIVVVPGGKVTMYFAITMFGQPGVEIMYPDPGFPIYRSVIEFSGAKAVPISLYEKTAFPSRRKRCSPGSPSARG